MTVSKRIRKKGPLTRTETPTRAITRMSIDALRRVVLNTHPKWEVATGDRVSAMFDVDRAIHGRKKTQKGHHRFVGTVVSVRRRLGIDRATVKWDDDCMEEHLSLELQPVQRKTNRQYFDEYMQTTDYMSEITHVSQEVVRVPCDVITLLYPLYSTGHYVPCRWVKFRKTRRLLLVPMSSMPIVNPSTTPVACVFPNLTKEQEEGKRMDLKALFDPTMLLPLALRNLRPFVTVQTMRTNDRMSILTHMFQHIIFNSDV